MRKLKSDWIEVTGKTLCPTTVLTERQSEGMSGNFRREILHLFWKCVTKAGGTVLNILYSAPNWFQGTLMYTMPLYSGNRIQSKSSKKSKLRFQNFSWSWEALFLFLSPQVWELFVHWFLFKRWIIYLRKTCLIFHYYWILPFLQVICYCFFD